MRRLATVAIGDSAEFATDTRRTVEPVIRHEDRIV